MLKHRIGVVRGSLGDHGSAVLAHVRNASPTELRDIFVDRDGAWLVNGRSLSRERALASLDVVVNALHGTRGESGDMSRLFETFAVPYTGSRPFASALAFRSDHARKRTGRMMVRSPQTSLVRAAENIHEQANGIIQSIPFPLLVTPLAGCASQSFRVGHFEGLVGALHRGTAEAPEILVEAHEPGEVVAVGLIDGFRGERVYALPLVALRHDYTFGGATEAIYPIPVSRETKRTVEDVARRLHHELGARHYAQYEFLVTPQKDVFFLHARLFPSLTEGAAFPRALEAVGANPRHFLEHLIEWALHV